MVITPVKYLGYFCPLGWIRLPVHSHQFNLSRIYWEGKVTAHTATGTEQCWEQGQHSDLPAAVPEVWQVPQNQGAAMRTRQETNAQPREQRQRAQLTKGNAEEWAAQSLFSRGSLALVTMKHAGREKTSLCSCIQHSFINTFNLGWKAVLRNILSLGHS